jgi:4-amino-4-deoxy-L-arabinose transferase-like glycosyltransferase
MKSFQKAFPYFLVVGILLNATGLFSEILEPDGALYANISKHIALSNNWLNLFSDGHDWLDKPHFPFWMTAISFKIFGMNAFAYKLPAFLFWLIGLRYTFLLANILYNKITAQVAAIIYLCALHGLLANFDVRAEPYLTALTIVSIYFFYKIYQTPKWLPLIICAFTSACAIMTKGIFVLITICGGFIFYWIVTKQWNQFLNYRWWVLLLLTIIFITPELYCLYAQFDMHPEKVIFGKTNVSGLKFFLWDSQFGRFFNTGPIKGKGDISFYLHTMLWAFLPFSILMYAAFIRLLSIKYIVYNEAQYIVIGSAGITFLLFSLSGFQLPHYIILIFPQLSVITSAYLISIRKIKSLKKIQLLQSGLLLAVAILIILLINVSGIKYSPVIYFLMLVVSVIVFIFFRKYNLNSIIASGLAFSVLLFLFLNFFFYPQLLKYQSGMMAGKWIKNNNTTNTVAMYKTFSYTFEFYGPPKIEFLYSTEDLGNQMKNNSEIIIYTAEKNLPELSRHGYHYTILKVFDHFHISMLSLDFLRASTRPLQIEKMCLLKSYL